MLELSSFSIDLKKLLLAQIESYELISDSPNERFVQSTSFTELGLVFYKCVHRSQPIQGEFCNFINSKKAKIRDYDTSIRHITTEMSELIPHMELLPYMEFNGTELVMESYDTLFLSLSLRMVKRVAHGQSFITPFRSTVAFKSESFIPNFAITEKYLNAMYFDCCMIMEIEPILCEVEDVCGEYEYFMTIRPIYPKRGLQLSINSFSISQKFSENFLETSSLMLAPLCRNNFEKDTSYALPSLFSSFVPSSFICVKRIKSNFGNIFALSKFIPLNNLTGERAMNISFFDQTKTLYLRQIRYRSFVGFKDGSLKSLKPLDNIDMGMRLFISRALLASQLNFAKWRASTLVDQPRKPILFVESSIETVNGVENFLVASGICSNDHCSIGQTTTTSKSNLYVTVLLLSDKIAEDNSDILSEFRSKYNILAIPCSLSPPIDVIVDSNTGICFVDTNTLLDASVGNKLLRDLALQCFKFRCIWILFYGQPSHICLTKLEILSAFSQFPCRIIARDMKSYNCSTDFVGKLSLQLIGEFPVSSSELSRRQLLEDLFVSHFHKKCEMLQLLPTINMMVAAYLCHTMPYETIFKNSKEKLLKILTCCSPPIDPSIIEQFLKLTRAYIGLKY